MVFGQIHKILSHTFVLTTQDFILVCLLSSRSARAENELAHATLSEHEARVHTARGQLEEPRYHATKERDYTGQTTSFTEYGRT